MRDAASRAQFLEACERVKRELSSAQEVTFTVPVAAGYRAAPPELTISREEAETLWTPTLQRMHAPIRRALRDAKLTPSEVGEIVLVGGATRMPIVRRLAEQMFGRPPLDRISPDEAVAQGAAVQIALKSGDDTLGDLVATDVAPFSLGVSVVDTLGRRRLDDVFSPVLERGTVLPASRVERFVTAADGQTHIRVQVYQGEHSLCRDNTKLGEYDLTGIPSAPAGEEAIDLRFTYDLNGILEVVMTIVSTGGTKTLVLERSPGRMNEAEVERARERLAALKFHPRDALPNTTALSRAETLFIELRGPDREALGTAMRVFRLALEEQAPSRIEQRRRELLLLVERLRR
jgi:molecular chaperone HscC